MVLPPTDMSPVVPVVVKLIVPPLPVVAAAVAPTALADRASLLEKAKVPPLSEMVPPPEVLLAFMVPPGTVKAPPPASSRTAPGSPSAVEGVLAELDAAGAGIDYAYLASVARNGAAVGNQRPIQ